MGDVKIGEHIDGWMDPEELRWLLSKAKEMETILEIGSWKGRSTYALCMGCKGKVVSVDHFKGSKEHQGRGDLPTIRDEFLKNTGEFSNLVSLVMSSEEASKVLEENFDMVFIDGSHEKEDVKKDLELWGFRWNKLICGHDWSHDGVSSSVREYFNGEYKLGPKSLWYKEKTQ